MTLQTNKNNIHGDSCVKNKESMEAFIVFGLFLILMYLLSKFHDTYLHRNDLDKCILTEDETKNSVSNQELSSYLSLQAKLNSLMISYEDTEDVFEAERHLQEMQLRCDQLKTEWGRENINIYRRKDPLDVLYYDKKIEKEFSNCDEWGWSNNKGGVIEKR